MMTPNSFFHSDRDRFLNPTYGPIDVIYARKQYYPWMVFAGSSKSYNSDTVPGRVQMIDNQDTLQWTYLTFFREFLGISNFTPENDFGSPPRFEI